MKRLSVPSILFLAGTLAHAEPGDCLKQLAARAPAPSGKVLFIGDSHSYGPIGDRLIERMGELPGVSYEFYGAWGSAPWSWLSGVKAFRPLRTVDQRGRPLEVTRTRRAEGPGEDEWLPKMSELLARFRPDLVVIEQGGNLMPIYPKDPAKVSGPDFEKMDKEAQCLLPAIEQSERSSRNLLKLVRDSRARCVWLAPPHSRRMIRSCFDQRYEKIKQWAEEAGCEFVDSRSLATYPSQGGDGLHYKTEMGDGVVAMAHAVADNAFERAVCPAYSTPTP